MSRMPRSGTAKKTAPPAPASSVSPEERAAYPVSYLASELDKRFEDMMARVEKGHLPNAEQLNQLWSGWKITRGLLLTKEQDIKRQYELTETDAKTGLINKTGLHRMLLALDARVLNRAPMRDRGAQELRSEQRDKSVHAVRVDIEGLKELYDRYVHTVADTYVAHIGRAVGKTCQRSSDIVARVDKNACIVLGFNMTNDGAEALAHKLLTAVRVAVAEAKGALIASGSVSPRTAGKVTATIGYAELDECLPAGSAKKETITQLAERIDAAMHTLRGNKSDRVISHKEFLGMRCGKK